MYSIVSWGPLVGSIAVVPSTGLYTTVDNNGMCMEPVWQHIESLSRVLVDS